MEVKSLDAQLGSWDPMKKDFLNSDFNNYVEGPGANLQRSLHASVASHKSATGDAVAPQPGAHQERETPYLMFKDVPKTMTPKALNNLCSQHGRVLAVRDSKKNAFMFVDLASVADMESVFRNLEHNSYGFKVQVGKPQSMLQPRNMNKNDGNSHLMPSEQLLSPPAMPGNPTKVCLQNRLYRASGHQPPRPQIERTPIVAAEHYKSKNSLLQRYDPLQHFLFTQDRYATEDVAVPQSAVNPFRSTDKGRNYRAGRSYIKISDKLEEFLKENRKASEGRYDATSQTYTHIPTASQPSANNSQPCRSGKCGECGLPCNLICPRCSTFFCSLPCQKAAWPQHRYICGKPKGFLKEQISAVSIPSNKVPIPPTISPVTTCSTSPSTMLAAKVSPPSATSAVKVPAAPVTATEEQTHANVLEVDMPASGSMVALTSINRTNVVFIRSNGRRDKLAFFKIISKIHEEAVGLTSPLTVQPKRGQIVLTRFEGQHNRAMVLNADNLEKVKVVHVDYGNLDTLRLDQLFEAPERLAHMPRLVRPVMLRDVPDVLMTDEIRQFLNMFLNDFDLRIRYDEKADFLPAKGVYRVDLIDETTNTHLNKSIAGFCTPQEPRDTLEVYMRQYLRQAQLPVGKNIELVVLDNTVLSTGCISCSTREYAAEIADMQKEIQKYGDSLAEQVYAPRVDELCIARYSVDGQWQRGRCLDLVGDGFPTIVYFDYGNIEYVPIKDIRRYPREFTYPIMTCDCEIEGLTEQCSAEVVNRLEELIPNGSTIRCENIAFFEKEQYYSIALPGIIAMLRAEGLLDEC